MFLLSESLYGRMSLRREILPLLERRPLTASPLLAVGLGLYLSLMFDSTHTQSFFTRVLEESTLLKITSNRKKCQQRTLSLANDASQALPFNFEVISKLGFQPIERVSDTQPPVSKQNISRSHGPSGGCCTIKSYGCAVAE